MVTPGGIDHPADQYRLQEALPRNQCGDAKGEAQLNDSGTPVWETYKQFQKAGCQVRKVENASLVVFYKEIEADRDAPESASDDQRSGSASSAWLYVSSIEPKGNAESHSV